jgi:dipeptidyl-peptidase 4
MSRSIISGFDFFVLISLALVAGQVCAQSAPHAYRDDVEAHWFCRGDKFWYRNEISANNREFVLVDATTGTRGPAFDHARVAAELSVQTGKQCTAQTLPIDSIAISDDGKNIRLYGPTQSWNLDLASYQISTATNDGSPSTMPSNIQPHPSPNSDEETSIRFVNKTTAEARIFWIDTNGARVSYGAVAAEEDQTLDTYVGHVWVVTDPSGRMLGVFEAGPEPSEAVITSVGFTPSPESRPMNDNSDNSPDGKWVAFVRDDNLWLRDRASNKEIQLSRDGTVNNTYHPDHSRDRGIELAYTKPDPPPWRPQVYWSPDSRHVVAMKTHRVPEHLVYEVQSSPPGQEQPRLISYPYFKAGDPIPTKIPHLFDVSSQKEIPVESALFPTPWDISDIRWSPDSSRFTFQYVQRGYQIVRIIGVEAACGQAMPVVDEQSKTFIDYSGKMYCEYLDDSHEIIWMSERDGWNHLYLYDSLTGKVKNQITRGAWVVRGVDLVDAQKRQIWFHAGGIYPGQDPYYIHYCRINFDGTGLVMLTEGNGTHTIKYSPDRRFLIDTWSQVDVAPITELRRTADGKLICRLETGDMSQLLAAGWKPPIQFAAKGRDGDTDIYGVIYRPPNWNFKNKYPVLEDIYAGPQDSFVPKEFSARLRERAMVDLGFVVVQIDGMGTSNRSKAFHDVCWKNLGDAGFPDRILWMKAAAAKFPWMDLNRVGIFGTSAGGQDALTALESHGDFYKAAVADCGCYDNRMDKAWWNEQWMGWPVGPQYSEQSDVNNAYKLRGKLLLIGCELDHNVDPASTMQVVNALIKADKDFEMLIVPGADHGQDGTYGQRRRAEFFTRCLMGTGVRQVQ